MPGIAGAGVLCAAVTQVFTLGAAAQVFVGAGFLDSWKVMHFGDGYDPAQGP